MPRDDDFLALNLADTYAAVSAIGFGMARVADANLRYKEETVRLDSDGSETDVPNARAEPTGWRGKAALKQIRKLEPTSAYPLLRLVKHTLIWP